VREKYLRKYGKKETGEKRREKEKENRNCRKMEKKSEKIGC
jgi:hypothetical protein